MNPDSLRDGILASDQRALARGISMIERRRDGYRELVAELYQHPSQAQIIGMTGSPGAGKSTLVNRLIREYREQDLRVGVIAIDPSSPFTGGAILGDRIRMDASRGDTDVFIRSLSTGGALGGLAPTTDDVITTYQAYGMDRIIVETVGTGQNEVDIVETADTVAVVCQPSQGDDIQLLKAGILEIGDLFVLNKADRPGVERMFSALQQMIRESSERNPESNVWIPPIVRTVATEDTGISSLVETIDEHDQFLRTSGGRNVQQQRRFRAHLRRILRDEIERRIDAALTSHADEIDEAADPYTVASTIVKTSLTGETHETE